MKKITEIYDLETFKSIFLYCSLNIETMEMKVFEISREKNDIVEIYKHLETVKGQIGYNNIEFDSCIIAYLLYTKYTFLHVSGTEGAELIHLYANSVIQNGRGLKCKISQLDLYKLHHLNRYKVSLKYVAFNLDNEIIMDLPFNPTKTLNFEELEVVRKYVTVDVNVTYKLYKYSSNILKLRKNTKEKYGINCFNMSNTSVGKNIFLKEYSEKSNIPIETLKYNSTTRSFVYPKDIISDRIKFKTERYNKLLNDLKNNNINLVTDELNIRFHCNTITCDIKKGGLHSINSSSYWENKDYVILDIDEGSFYPNLLIELEICPKHLNKEIFIHIVNKITQQRLKAKENKDSLVADNFKIVINSIYGLLKAEGSPIKDEEALYKTTLNGQLFLLMLTELLEEINGVKILYQNTDGIMIKYDRSLQEEVSKALDEFREILPIPLEEVYMKSVFMENSSSYIAITEDGKIKRKGSFKLKEDKELKENSSANIIPIALQNYYVNGIAIEETINNHKNIFDFYIGFKKMENQKYLSYEIKDGELVERVYNDKVIRLYVTTQNNSTIKYYTDSEKEERVISGYNTKIVQEHVNMPIEEYKINYRYYIAKCYQIVNSIDFSRGLFD